MSETRQTPESLALEFIDSEIERLNAELSRQQKIRDRLAGEIQEISQDIAETENAIIGLTMLKEKAEAKN